MIANGKFSFFYMASSIPFHICMYHIFFFYSSVYGHLGPFLSVASLGCILRDLPLHILDNICCLCMCVCVCVFHDSHSMKCEVIISLWF